MLVDLDLVNLEELEDKPDGLFDLDPKLNMLDDLVGAGLAANAVVDFPAIIGCVPVNKDF